jgi:hypothetical protein
MDVLELLKPLCGNKDRPMDARLLEPFAITWGTGRHLGACDGHGLLLIRSDDHPEVKAATTDYAAVIPTKGEKALIAVPSLLSWALEGAPTETVCSSCKGAKMTECHARCWNPETEDVHGKHWTECRTCSGTGKPRIFQRPGRVLGFAFDRSIIVKFLTGMEGEAELLVEPEALPDPNQTSGMLRLIGQGWVFALMGMRASPTEALPVFETQPVAAEKVG